MGFPIWRLSHPRLFNTRPSVEITEETSSTVDGLEDGPKWPGARKKLKKQSHYIEDSQGVFANHLEAVDYQHNVDKPVAKSA
jgi:hypothetical protein